MRKSKQEHTRKYKHARHLKTHYRRWENMEINLKYITSGYGEWIYVAQDGEQVRPSLPR